MKTNKPKINLISGEGNWWYELKMDVRSLFRL